MMGLSVQKLADLESAILYGDPALPEVIALLDSGLPANCKISQKSALYLAIERDQTLIAELLLARGASVKSGYFTETPLHIAAVRGNVPVAGVLLAKGAAVNARNHNGCTPLWLAASEGRQGVLTRLLEQPDVDVDCYCDDIFLMASVPRTTALCQSVIRRHYSVSQALINAGANVNMADVKGYTPLHRACASGDAALTSLLIQHGCSLNHVSKEGFTPLHLAVRRQHSNVVQALVNAGCEVNADGCDDPEFFPLHMAVRMGNSALVAALCSSSDLDIDRTDGCSTTPLIAAVKSASADCLNRLLHSGRENVARDDWNLQSLSGICRLDNDPRVQGLLRQRRVKVKRREQEGKVKGNGKDGDERENQLCDSDEMNNACNNNKQHGDGENVHCDTDTTDRTCDDRTHHGHRENTPCHSDETNRMCSVEEAKQKTQSLDADNSQSSALSDLLLVCVQSLGPPQQAEPLAVLSELMAAGGSLQRVDHLQLTPADHALTLHGLQGALLLLCHGAAFSQDAAGGARLSAVRGFLLPLLLARGLTSPCRFPHMSLPLAFRGVLSSPLTLTRLCRAALREMLVRRTPGSILPLVMQLPVPVSVQQFVLLSDVLKVLMDNREQFVEEL